MALERTGFSDHYAGESAAVMQPLMQ